MALFAKFFKKGRRYPIEYDEDGRSARRRAFDLFGQGLKPRDIVKKVDITIQTARHYYVDYLRRPKDVDLHVDMIRRSMKAVPGFSPKVIAGIAPELGMSEAEVVKRLQKPWGIKSFVLGRWPNPKRDNLYSQQEARLAAALNLINFMEFRGLSLDESRETMRWLIGMAATPAGRDKLRHLRGHRI